MKCNAVQQIFYISLPFPSYTGAESSLYELSQFFEAIHRQFNIPLDVESNNNVTVEGHNSSLRRGYLPPV